MSVGGRQGQGGQPRGTGFFLENEGTRNEEGGAARDRCTDHAQSSTCAGPRADDTQKPHTGSEQAGGTWRLEGPPPPIPAPRRAPGGCELICLLTVCASHLLLGAPGCGPGESSPCPGLWAHSPEKASTTPLPSSGSSLPGAGCRGAGSGPPALASHAVHEDSQQGQGRGMDAWWAGAGMEETRDPTKDSVPSASGWQTRGQAVRPEEIPYLQRLWHGLKSILESQAVASAAAHLRSAGPGRAPAGPGHSTP